ncbi:MAG TPA: hypothetical protein VHI78_07205, partial [Bacteroidales bacterium]|nr:hypothetical protein [Bacteroidales bacterium]
MAISNILKKFFGSKSQRDIKEVLPLLNKIREAYTQIEKLSNDELRSKTHEIRDYVLKSTNEKEKQISDLRGQVEAGTLDVELLEETYREIDRIEKDMTGDVEKALTEV